jgi:putative ABC transport system permease protein
MSTIVHDFRLAIRRWTTRPALGATAVLILGLGVGATTSIYSIVDAVLLRPLVWTEPDRLVNVYVARPELRLNPVQARLWDRGGLTWPMLKYLQTKTSTLQAFGAWRAEEPTLNGAANEVVPTLLTTANLLPMLGLRSHQGRFFTPEEDDAAADVVIVSYETWHRRYGGRADILGQTISLNETRLTIVGVLPQGFRFGTTVPAEFLLPMGRIPVGQRAAANHFLRGVARLAPGVTLANATQELDPIISGDEGLDKKRAHLVWLEEDERGPSRRPLLVLLVAAGLLLLIATSNVAALLLGDAAGRRHELAVRAALGGARRQIARQLFAESVVLAGVAAAVGLVVAAWLTPVLVSLAPTALPLMDTVRLDARVFVFALALTFASSLLFGVVPSLTLGSAEPAGALREGGPDGALQQTPGYRWVVAGQIVLSTILLVGAGLLGETVRQMTSQPLGFDANGLIVTNVRLPSVAGVTPPQRVVRLQSLLDRVTALPDVVSATATNSAPFGISGGASRLQIPGRALDRDATANRHIVTERYFETLGIPVVKGRGFDAGDGPGGYSAVVTDEFERILMEGDALGKRFLLNGNEHTIVGVVPAVKQRRYTDDPSIAFYLLSRQVPSWETLTIIIRAAGGPDGLLPTLRRAIAEAEPQVSFVTLETMATMTSRSIAEERFRAQLAIAFAATAVLLSAIGLYGLIARSVSDRRREIGVRLAVGADPGQVRRLVLRQALGLVGLGVVIGVPTALLAARGLATFLYGVTPASPLALAIAVATITSAAGLAALGPALSAARIDPIEALRR